MGQDKSRRELMECWELLDGPERRSVLDFARYLSTRSVATGDQIPTPSTQPRPESETVVAAIKRLRRVYHMVDRREVMGETATLMSCHVIEGRAAVDVIDELERVFELHYRRLVDAP